MKFLSDTRKSGFTLLELLITVSLVSLVLPAIFILSKNGMDLSGRIQDELTQTGQLENAVFLWIGDIRSSESVREISARRLVMAQKKNKLIIYEIQDHALLRVDPDGTKKKILKKIRNIQWSPDRLPPRTRHLVLRVEMDALKKQPIVTSAAVGKWAQ